MQRVYLLLISILIFQSMFGQKYLSDFIDSSLDRIHFSNQAFDKIQNLKFKRIQILGQFATKTVHIISLTLFNCIFLTTHSTAITPLVAILLTGHFIKKALLY